MLPRRRATGEATGGFAAPVNSELAGAWSLAGQVQFDWAEEEDGDGVESFFSHAPVLSRAIAGGLSGYLDYSAEAGVGHGNDLSPLLSAGLVYELNPDTLFDVALLVGLDNGDLPDLALFAGMTIRF